MGAVRSTTLLRSYCRLPAYFVLTFCLFCDIACKPKETSTPQPVIPTHLQNAVVLCFHDVGRSGRYAIPLADFNAILDRLGEFRVVSLADWVNGLNPEDKRRRVVLTFDDGYAAHRELVLPELEKRGLGATFFFYADQLQRDKKWLSLTAAADAAFDFGSHSWSHALLRDVGYDAMFRELYLARTFMEGLTRKRIASFAWPYGYYSDEGLKAAQSAGFSYQVSVDYRIATRADILRVIPRYTVFGKKPVDQVRQILSAFQKEKPAGSDPGRRLK
jgi:peptidoglycan/xylan/chitin deacetylase (PgdA/CDA1 family)